MFDSIGNWLEGWRVVQQIGIAYLLTALIGWNREREAHTTGIRTFPIVGIASCGYILALGSQPDVAAQSRVLQGLITGIGFIGGGAILKEGATVKGTATAASRRHDQRFWFCPLDVFRRETRRCPSAGRRRGPKSR